jgi:hypothetical protein
MEEGRLSFVTGGIEEAPRLAKQATGDKDVKIGGGVSTVRQASPSWVHSFPAIRACTRSYSVKEKHRSPISIYGNGTES